MTMAPGAKIMTHGAAPELHVRRVVALDVGLLPIPTKPPGYSGIMPPGIPE